MGTQTIHVCRSTYKYVSAVGRMVENIVFTTVGDDKPSATMRETLKDRGTIRVEFRRGRISHYDDGNFKESFRSVGSSVPEKGLKGRAISNRIESVRPAASREARADTSRRLGAMEPIRAVGTVQLEWPYGKEPFATAVFNYRSRSESPSTWASLLQANDQ